MYLDFMEVLDFGSFEFWRFHCTVQRMCRYYELLICTVSCVVYNMQNCSGGVNSDCVAANPGQEWMCFFAQVFMLMSIFYSRT